MRCTVVVRGEDGMIAAMVAFLSSDPVPPCDRTSTPNFYTIKL